MCDISLTWTHEPNHKGNLWSIARLFFWPSSKCSTHITSNRTSSPPSAVLTASHSTQEAGSLESTPHPPHPPPLPPHSKTREGPARSRSWGKNNIYILKFVFRGEIQLLCRRRLHLRAPPPYQLWRSATALAWRTRRGDSSHRGSSSDGGPNFVGGRKDYFPFGDCGFFSRSYILTSKLRGRVTCPRPPTPEG